MQYRLCVALPAAEHVMGWLLLGERRNAYPWFDAERRYLALVAELLGSALDAMGAGELENNSGAAQRARDSSRETELEELKSRLAASQRELVASRRELAAMRERLDPDLIAQVLEIAQEVGQRDPEAALGILHSLHRVYVYLLEESNGGVSLGEEIAFAQDLLALEKLRRRNRLDVSLSFDPKLREQLVPHLILQPLIENALVHGLSRELHPGSIEIHAKLNASRCHITVEDNGSGFLGDLHQDALRGEGGLSRVLRSMKELFGDDVLLRVEHPEPRGTRVCLEFPPRHHRDRKGLTV
jgi:LytS/YehU family sensor histidine kinase